MVVRMWNTEADMSYLYRKKCISKWLIGIHQGILDYWLSNEKAGLTGNQDEFIELIDIC